MSEIMGQLFNGASNFQSFVTVLTILINLLLAAGIAKDTGELSRSGVHTRFAAPWVWSFATFVLGIWVVLIYWLIHHSQLGRRV